MIDVHIDRPDISRAVLYVLLFGCAAGMVFAILVVGVLSGAKSLFVLKILAGSLAVAGLIILKHIGQRRMERRIADLVGHREVADIASLAQAVARREVGLTREVPISELVHRLALAGRVGETIRLHWAETPDPIEPLTVAFEPRPLDEADPTFEEIEAGSAPIAEEDRPARRRLPPTQQDDALAMRRIRRNLLFKGGWIVACFPAAYLLITAWESYRRQTMTWGVPFAVAFLMLILYGPVTGGLFGTRQWFVVPGGLVVRKARQRDRRYQVHLFDRWTSVLSVYQLKKRIWMVTAADADAYETRVATKKEVDFLLRAWLSPLQPPSLEHLSDLA